MVRFKNRYLLTELVWADGKVDDALTSYDLYRSIKDRQRTRARAYGCATVSFCFTVFLFFFKYCCHACVLRFSVLLNFGDVGFGRVQQSLNGTRFSRGPP